jgi:hypothetical protein
MQTACRRWSQLEPRSGAQSICVVLKKGAGKRCQEVNFWHFKKENFVILIWRYNGVFDVESRKPKSPAMAVDWMF